MGEKTPRVSSQSDENILNANGEELPRVKLNSGQVVAGKCTGGKMEFFSICAVFYALICCNNPS